MGRPNLSFFAMSFILLFAVIGFILIVFDLHRFAFVFELGLLLIYMLVLTFSMFMIYHNVRWGWTLLGATLIILLLNTFFISLLLRTFETAHITTIFFSVVGLVLTLLNLRHPVHEPVDIEEQQDKAKNYYPFIDKMEPELAKSNVEKTFTPGKFVASKKAGKYHVPKCDWAKRISKANQLWFNNEQEAESQGFEKDGCVG